MSSLPSVVLFLGPEVGHKEEELNALRQRIEKETNSPVDEHRFYLPDASVQDCLDLLQNGSLFSDHTLVLLSGVEQLGRKEEIGAIAEFCKSPNLEATLVLMSDQVRIDRRLESAVPGSSKKIFWELFDNQKRGWLANHFRKYDVSIEPEALALFLELVENNTLQLRAEADKLCIFVGRGGEISLHDVETFIYHGKDENVFTLFKSIVSDDVESALEDLEKILSSGESVPIQLVGGIHFQLKRLLALRTMVDNEVRLQDAFQRLNIRGKRIQADYQTGIQRFTTEDIERQIEVLTNYDVLFRTLRPGIHRCLVDLLIYQLMFGAQRLVQRGAHIAGEPEPLLESVDDLIFVR